MEEVREEAEAGRVEEVEEGVEAGRMEEVGEEPEAGRMRGEANVCVAGGDHGRSDGNPERAPSKPIPSLIPSPTKNKATQRIKRTHEASSIAMTEADPNPKDPPRKRRVVTPSPSLSVTKRSRTAPSVTAPSARPRSTRQSAVASTMFISGMYSASGRPVSQTRRDGQAPTGNAKPANSQSKKGKKRI
ncbi:hypothetical protein AAF712_009426 [Marasmius tenuissimus]|uniref:Uncharacterized protein n=1 Tax=Marasmius tenuissimus TaxID=585030 RepID=A0ABR2ZQI5_9AGAR